MLLYPHVDFPSIQRLKVGVGMAVLISLAYILCKRCSSWSWDFSQGWAPLQLKGDSHNDSPSEFATMQKVFHVSILSA